MKRQVVDWEKMFSNCISNKGLVSRTYKDLSKLKETKNEQKIWVDTSSKKIYAWQTRS